MSIAVIYFSRTGNTKRLAQAIANVTKAPLIDIASSLPSTLEKYETVIIGTPVEGANPAKETLAFIQGMNRNEGAKVILFTTYRLFGNMRTMKDIEKILSAKGYSTIAMVSKKGMKPDQEADFSDVLCEIQKALTK